MRRSTLVNKSSDNYDDDFETVVNSTTVRKIWRDTRPGQPSTTMVRVSNAKFKSRSIHRTDTFTKFIVTS